MCSIMHHINIMHCIYVYLLASLYLMILCDIYVLSFIIYHDMYVARFCASITFYVKRVHCFVACSFHVLCVGDVGLARMTSP